MVAGPEITTVPDIASVVKLNGAAGVMRLTMASIRSFFETSLGAALSAAYHSFNASSEHIA